LEKTLLFCLLIIISCSERPNDNESMLVVSKTEIPKDLKEPPLPPPHPYSYYGWFNFIFDADGKLYFYQHSWDRKKKPIRVIDFDSNAPVFINLNPDQIVEIPATGVKDFVEQNILNVEEVLKDVRVVGVTDTIKSKSLDPLLKLLNDASHHIRFSVRRITYEESVVLDYKKRQEFYSLERVKWDSTKVLFDRKRME
jgi:hypothetical protein